MRRILMAAALILSTAAAVRAEGEATVKATRGHVSVKPAATGTWVHAKPGMVLSGNDQVITGRNGAVQVDFNTGATMLVKELSKFSFRVDKWGKVVSFRTGEFLIGLRRKLTGSDKFRVRTPVSVAAIQGTVFWGKADETAENAFACFTGHVEVWANGKNIMLQPGEKTTILPKGQPADPAPNDIPLSYAQNFAIDGSIAGLDQQIADESAQPATP